MPKVPEIVQHNMEAPGPVIKAVNWLAAVLAGGSFLGLVNIAVGVLSGIWLALQVWGFFRYTIPKNRDEREIRNLQKEIHRRELERLRTKPGDLCD